MSEKRDKILKSRTADKSFRKALTESPLVGKEIFDLDPRRGFRKGTVVEPGVIQGRVWVRWANGRITQIDHGSVSDKHRHRGYTWSEMVWDTAQHLERNGLGHRPIPKGPTPSRESQR